jgi:hypothetical protein
MCKVEVGKYVQTIREDSGIWGVEFKLNIRAKSEVHLGVLVLKHHGKLSMLEDLQGNVIDCKFLLANELIECDTLMSFGGLRRGGNLMRNSVDGRQEQERYIHRICGKRMSK